MNNYASPDRMLDSRDVARWLGISQRTVCLWAECGEIPAFKIGRHWKFSESVLKSWVAGRAEKADSKARGGDAGS